MPTQVNNTYDLVVQVSEEYLGPAGERFIRRQISTHIGVDPERLRKQDIPQLVDWVKLAFALLTNDHKEIESFAERLLALTNHAPGKNYAKG